jgi:hypothetical protein
VQDPPARRLEVAVQTPVPVPLIERPSTKLGIVTDKVDVPTLLTVIVWTAVELTATFPNAMEVGESVSCEVEVPVRTTAAGGRPPALVTVRVAVLRPTASVFRGEKLTWMVQVVAAVVAAAS